MKHTPGPWTYKKCPTGYPDLFTFNVNQLYPDPDHNCICGIASGLDSEDDARLIAAAPDLLEACEMALRVLIQTKPNDYVTETINDLNNALNKAKGE